MIELQEAVKQYGKLKAVDSISFTAESGEIFGLLGPNGAGKTTTIRMIMNIIAPDTGRILFDGRQMTEADKNRIGYLPEERGLYKKMRVEELLLYVGRLKEQPDERLRPNITRWLSTFGLSEWKNRKIEELSKGMAQKVQFMAAVVHDPDIMFFDEPFSGLDPVSTDQLRESIHSLAQEGKTVLFSTHIMEQAEKICSRILLMNRGKEVVSGTLSDVKNRFGQRTVHMEFSGDGSFIGSLPQVARVVSFPRYSEITLSEGADTDALLRNLASRLSISSYTISTPSLHSIFISLAGSEEGR